MIKVEYLGYQAHYYLPCNFHLTTVITSKNRQVIVSTIGLRTDDNNNLVTIDMGRFFETMVFKTKNINGFIEADTLKILKTYKHNMIDEDIELKIFNKTISNEELLKVRNQCEKFADKKHKEVVKKYIKNLKRSENRINKKNNKKIDNQESRQSN